MRPGLSVGSGVREPQCESVKRFSHVSNNERKPILSFRSQAARIGRKASPRRIRRNVVRPAGLSVHALPDMQRFEQGFIVIAGELAALVGVDDGFEVSRDFYNKATEQMRGKAKAA